VAPAIQVIAVFDSIEFFKFFWPSINSSIVLIYISHWPSKDWSPHEINS
jgi:hypothetical protein